MDSASDFANRQNDDPFHPNPRDNEKFHQEVEDYGDLDHDHGADDGSSNNNEQQDYAVFVGGSVPSDITEDELINIFQGCGPISKIQAEATRRKGYVFVCFQTPDGMMNAIRQFKTLQIRGRPCVVNMGGTKSKIYFRGCPEHATFAMVSDWIVNTCGPYIDLVYKDGEIAGNLFFLTNSIARDMVSKLSAAPLITYSPDDVDHARPISTLMTVMMESERQLRKQGAVTNKLYVGNLPNDCTEEQISQHFSQYGTVKRCAVVFRDGKRFAFLDMGTADDAQRAIVTGNATNYNGSILHVRFDREALAAAKRGYGSGGRHSDGGRGGRDYGRDFDSRSSSNRGNRDDQRSSSNMSNGGQRDRDRDFNRGPHQATSSHHSSEFDNHRGGTHRSRSRDRFEPAGRQDYREPAYPDSSRGRDFRDDDRSRSAHSSSSHRDEAYSRDRNPYPPPPSNRRPSRSRSPPYRQAPAPAPYDDYRRGPSAPPTYNSSRDSYSSRETVSERGYPSSSSASSSSRAYDQGYDRDRVEPDRRRLDDNHYSHNHQGGRRDDFVGNNRRSRSRERYQAPPPSSSSGHYPDRDRGHSYDDRRQSSPPRRHNSPPRDSRDTRDYQGRQPHHPSQQYTSRGRSISPPRDSRSGSSGSRQLPPPEIPMYQPSHRSTHSPPRRVVSIPDSKNVPAPYVPVPFAGPSSSSSSRTLPSSNDRRSQVEYSDREYHRQSSASHQSASSHSPRFAPADGRGRSPPRMQQSQQPAAPPTMYSSSSPPVYAPPRSSQQAPSSNRR